MNNPQQSNIVLEARGIQQNFGGVQALVDGSFTLRAGEVHAIMGENGAGKSTLGKILAGVVTPRAGSMQLAGKPYRPEHPRHAQAAGVAMIFQELDLFPELSVAENMVAANLAFEEGVVARRTAMEAFSAPFLAQVGFRASCRTRVADLPIGEQQLVAIARALSMKPRIIVMDESTSALTEDAVTNLFSVIQSVKALGISVIFVSHKMDEIFAVCDRVTVLRDGRTVGGGTPSEMSMDELVRLMVGRPVDRSVRAPSRAGTKVVLCCEGLSTHRLREVTFDLREAEVLGVAGLVGSGRSEIGRALFGLDLVRAGRMTLRGASYLPASPQQAIQCGVGLVPEDRKAMGLMMQMSVRENATLTTLSQLSTCGVLSGARERECHEAVAGATALKSADDDAPVSQLSGGNQQKVLLGRWLMVDPDILFLDDPTRGVDVGAKEDIYRLIETRVGERKSVILVSSELPELLRCCDRILVMNQGCVAGVLDARSTTQEEIMHRAAGGLEAPAGKPGKEEICES